MRFLDERHLLSFPFGATGHGGELTGGWRIGGRVVRFDAARIRDRRVGDMVKVLLLANFERMI